MRPITTNEYKRMRSQVEARVAGMSMISFKMFAKIAGGTDWGTHMFNWYETGYMCDFRIPNFSVEGDNQQNVFSDLFNGQQRTDKVAAQAVLPMRYLTEKSALKVKEAPITSFNGSYIDIINMPPGPGPVNADTVVPPLVEEIRLDEYNGMRLNSIVDFDIVSRPLINADCFLLALIGKETLITEQSLNMYQTPVLQRIPRYGRTVGPSNIVVWSYGNIVTKWSWDNSLRTTLSGSWRTGGSFPSVMPGTVWRNGRSYRVR